jgi:hypothetical protein
MKKMINSAKFFCTFTKVLRVAFMIAAWICGVVAALVWLLPESAFVYDTETITFGSVSITLIPDGTVDLALLRGKLSAMLLVCTIVFVFTCMVLRVLRHILEPMEQGQPFGDAVVPNLKKLAWLSLIGGGIFEIVKLVMLALILGSRDLMAFFNPAVVQSVEVQYEMNLWFVAVFILLMLMSHIFAYGQQLQQLSDETL